MLVDLFYLLSDLHSFKFVLITIIPFVLRHLSYIYDTVVILLNPLKYLLFFID